MSGELGGWASPGVGTDRTTFESELYWGADQARNAALFKSATISGSAADAGNTPTYLLRPGLILGQISASGKLLQWDSAATDGSQYIHSVLDIEQRMQDIYDGTAADRTFRVVCNRAPLKAGALLIKGAALVGHADEYLARRQLAAAGFVLDDDTNGLKAGASREATVTGTTDVLTAAENGSTLFYSNAAAVAVTLPAIKAGLEFTTVRVADEELVVASAAGDDIVVGNDLSADSVTVTTAGEQIGASYTFRSAYVAGTLKWLIRINVVPFSTDDYLAKSIAT